MKNLIKKNKFIFIILFTLVLLINFSGKNILIPLKIYINKGILLFSLPTIVAIVVFILSYIGIIIVSLKINKTNITRKIILEILILSALTLFLLSFFTMLINIISETIYSSLTGSILNVKIIIHTLVPFLRTPIYALLLCIFKNILDKHKLMNRVSLKEYFKILLFCFIITTINFLFLLLPSSIFLPVSQNIILSFLTTLLILFIFDIREDV